MLSLPGECAQPARRSRHCERSEAISPGLAAPSSRCFLLPLHPLKSPQEQRKGGASMIDKFVRSVAEAMAGIKDGSTVLIAGFAQVGEPRALIDGLIEQGAKDLTVVHNTAGRGQEGVARLIGEGRVRKIMCSFARSR